MVTVQRASTGFSQYKNTNSSAQTEDEAQTYSKLCESRAERAAGQSLTRVGAMSSVLHVSSVHSSSSSSSSVTVTQPFSPSSALQSQLENET